MDEDAIRGELEHSGDDYLSDLDEEFCDLSSEEDGVNQVSRAEPSCKKAKLVSEHCQWIRKILKRKLVSKGQRDL
jgi:hypothetical protein